jgi:SAM-dependent methyltransferase
LYDQIITNLRQSYDHTAQDRDQREIVPWKIEERAYFLSLLQQEGKQNLLEIGAGPGWHGKFFQDNGLTVVCTDLSPEMVKLCRARGLAAYTMDFLSLDFPDGSFDAIYALNCLLHVPRKDLPKVLRALQALLKPAGLFYLGVYGGKDSEGVWPQDHHDPKRFFSFHTDEQLCRITTEFFELLYFEQIPLEGDNEFHFQSLILRRNR